jgi:hypothetical protein
MDEVEVEDYILQMLAGIIPRELWMESRTRDPFEGWDCESARSFKRKFRKIKKKAGVKKYDYSVKAWEKITRYLRNKEVR